MDAFFEFALEGQEQYSAAKEILKQESQTLFEGGLKDQHIVYDDKTNKISIGYNFLEMADKYPLFRDKIIEFQGWGDVKAPKQFLFEEQFATAGYKHYFVKRRAELLEKASKEADRYNREANELPEPAAKDFQDVASFFQDKHNQGLIVGDNHQSATAKEFLIDNMLAFEAAGVKTLYIEHFRDDHQADLDAYFDPENHDIDNIPPGLQKFLGKQDGTNLEGLRSVLLRNKDLREEAQVYFATGAVGKELESYLEEKKEHSAERGLVALLKSAKSCGMRVIGIDSVDCKFPNINNDPQQQENRVLAMNQHAKEVFDLTRKSAPEEKFVVFCGAQHNVRHDSGALGLNKMMGAPAIRFAGYPPKPALAKDSLTVVSDTIVQRSEASLFKGITEGNIVTVPRGTSLAKEFEGFCTELYGNKADDLLTTQNDRLRPYYFKMRDEAGKTPLDLLVETMAGDSPEDKPFVSALQSQRKLLEVCQPENTPLRVFLVQEMQEKLNALFPVEEGTEFLQQLEGYRKELAKSEGSFEDKNAFFGQVCDSLLKSATASAEKKRDLNNPGACLQQYNDLKLQAYLEPRAKALNALLARPDIADMTEGMIEKINKLPYKEALFDIAIKNNYLDLSKNLAHLNAKLVQQKTLDLTYKLLLSEHEQSDNAVTKTLRLFDDTQSYLGLKQLDMLIGMDDNVKIAFNNGLQDFTAISPKVLSHLVQGDCANLLEIFAEKVPTIYEMKFEHGVNLYQKALLGKAMKIEDHLHRKKLTSETTIESSTITVIEALKHGIIFQADELERADTIDHTLKELYADPANHAVLNLVAQQMLTPRESEGAKPLRIFMGSNATQMTGRATSGQGGFVPENNVVYLTPKEGLKPLIMHELTHVAMQIAFENNAKPYNTPALQESYYKALQKDGLMITPEQLTGPELKKYQRLAARQPELADNYLKATGNNTPQLIALSERERGVYVAVQDGVKNYFSSDIHVVNFIGKDVYFVDPEPVARLKQSHALCCEYQFEGGAAGKIINLKHGVENESEPLLYQKSYGGLDDFLCNIVEPLLQSKFEERKIDQSITLETAIEANLGEVEIEVQYVPEIVDKEIFEKQINSHKLAGDEAIKQLLKSEEPLETCGVRSVLKIAAIEKESMASDLKMGAQYFMDAKNASLPEKKGNIRSPAVTKMLG